MSEVTQEMRDREPFRWCVYCDADVQRPTDEPGVFDADPHRPDCPSVTGLWPITPKSCGEPCEHCGKRPSPGKCGCGHVFQVGDVYCLVAVDDEDDAHGVVPAAMFGAVRVYERVCVSCAAARTIDGMDGAE